MQQTVLASLYGDLALLFAVDQLFDIVDYLTSLYINIKPLSQIHYIFKFRIIQTNAKALNNAKFS